MGVLNPDTCALRSVNDEFCCDQLVTCFAFERVWVLGSAWVAVWAFGPLEFAVASRFPPAAEVSPLVSRFSGYSWKPSAPHKFLPRIHFWLWFWFWGLGVELGLPGACKTVLGHGVGVSGKVPSTLLDSPRLASTLLDSPRLSCSGPGSCLSLPLDSPRLSSTLLRLSSTLLDFRGPPVALEIPS